MSTLIERMAQAINSLPEMIEAAYRDGWRDGYAAGREDGRWDGTCWCDIDKDWSESESAASLRSLANQED